MYTTYVNMILLKRVHIDLYNVKLKADIVSVVLSGLKSAEVLR